MTKTKILAVAHAVPERVVTNKHLAQSFDVTPDELLAICGVKERRYIGEGEGGVQLAKEATEKALEAAGMTLDEIEMIIFACTYPDHQFPGNSAFLHKAFEMTPRAILDIRNQGVGFLNALQVADAYVRNGTYKRILVAASDIHSTGLSFDPKAKKITPHFGDAAAVVIVGPAEEGDDSHTIETIAIHTDARYALDWYIPIGSIQHPRLVPENFERGEHYPVIHWDVVNREAVRRVPEAILEVCEKAGRPAVGTRQGLRAESLAGDDPADLQGVGPSGREDHLDQAPVREHGRGGHPAGAVDRGAGAQDQGRLAAGGGGLRLRLQLRRDDPALVDLDPDHGGGVRRGIDCTYPDFRVRASTWQTRRFASW